MSGLHTITECVIGIRVWSDTPCGFLFNVVNHTCRGIVVLEELINGCACPLPLFNRGFTGKERFCYITENVFGRLYMWSKFTGCIT